MKFFPFLSIFSNIRQLSSRLLTTTIWTYDHISNILSNIPQEKVIKRNKLQNSFARNSVVFLQKCSEVSGETSQDKLYEATFLWKGLPERCSDMCLPFKPLLTSHSIWPNILAHNPPINLFPLSSNQYKCYLFFIYCKSL